MLSFQRSRVTYISEIDWESRDITRKMSAFNLLCGLVLLLISLQNTKSVHDLDLRPRNSRKYKKTLVVDLDETLIYSYPPTRPSQIRKDAVKTLRHLESTGWELIFWTAGTQQYADRIARQFRTSYHVPVSHDVLSKDHCERIVGRDRNVHYKKNVSRLVSRTRPLHSIVIVDNNAQYAYPKENVLEIHSWYGYDPDRFLASHPKCLFGDDQAMVQLREVLDKLELTQGTSPDIHIQASIATKLARIPESDRLITVADWFSFSEGDYLSRLAVEDERI